MPTYCNLYSDSTGWTNGKLKWHYGLTKVGSDWYWNDGTRLDYDVWDKM